MKTLALISSFVILHSSFAQAPLPPALVFKPLERTFWATAYTDEGIESRPSEILTLTNRFPITLVVDPYPTQKLDVIGHRLWHRVLNRTNVYDLGPELIYTIAAQTNLPPPPLRLRLLIPEQRVQLGPPTEPQRYFRSAVLTSTNLVDWNFLVGLKTKIGEATP